MRLSSLKLSGFKSFADRSILKFKDNRTAVVGPNGCGKSNIIDAIRWVMGESSARQLRGGRMQDVIFTGTVKRKPVGLASVELHFDNTNGKIGGAYSAYNELAVRRQVNREGKSEYFLNGTKCRRRDITDLFLGTGLGPRSYAIIEQGMINRLVDAKPEELRIFIEEAAGISRYQARRRETLQHLEVTTQNLARLDDIAQELSAQLKTLKRQADAAVQYKALDQQILTIKVEILSFQCEQSTRLQHEYSLSMNELSQHFELVRSELHTVEHDLGQSQVLFQHLMEQSTPLQQEWQQAEKHVSELKASLQQKKLVLQQNQHLLEQLTVQKDQHKARIQILELQLEELIDIKEKSLIDVQQKEENAQQQQQNLRMLKEQYDSVLQHFERTKQQLEQYQQQQVKLVMHREQLDKNLQRILQQKAQIEQQENTVKNHMQADNLVELKNTLLRESADLLEAEQQLALLQQHCDDLQQQIGMQENQCRQVETDIRILKVEQSNLQKLRQQHQKKDDAIPMLMHSLVLSAEGLQHAELIEKFLAHWLTADVLTSDQDYQIERARQLKIQPYDVDVAELSILPKQKRRYLSDWITAPQMSLWQQVYIVDERSGALALQCSLTKQQSILSLDGYHVGQDWVIGLFYDANQAEQGILSHHIRLEEIEQQLLRQQPYYVQVTTQLSELQQQFQHAQKHYQQHAMQCKEKQKTLQIIALKKMKFETEMQGFAQQQQQFEQQLQQINVQYQEDTKQKDALDIDLQVVALKLEQIVPDYNALQFKVDALLQQRDEQQQKIQQQRQDCEHQQRLSIQQQQQIEMSKKDLTFLNQQYHYVSKQIEQITAFVTPLIKDLPELEQAYAIQQEKTAQLAKTWQTWQIELNTIQQKQQNLNEKRQSLQQQEEQLRVQLEEKRLIWQATKTDFQHYSEQLKALNAEPKNGLKLDLIQHQLQLKKLQQNFDKLGAVNLVAATEYEDILARSTQLKHQTQDLQQTVDQLQSAMKSIDQETKKLFMSTFDQVNIELKALFPKVFQGGEACLILEDDWQSGVKLMARPPGKRNSSLALLSGGEKALTALALIFAIFRLNPAPFCVLDEVDAPLDDANVARFCNLVKELSEQVQFIYITHNKVAMTMATDLLGVTMPEPGTSKLVTVDLEQAKEYGLVAES